MTSKPPLLHIGYHKTASSWLQRRVFPKAPGLHYAVGPHEASRPLNALFFQVNSFSYDEERVREFIEPRLAQAGGKTPVISHEGFSGSPFSGGHGSKPTAHRLHDIFPEGRILLVIREQSDMLLSMYKQYIQAGGGASFSQFLARRGGAGSIASFRLDYLEYHRLIHCYQSLFSPQQVLVLAYELLLRDSTAFLERIGDFADADLGPPDPERQKLSRSAAALYAERHGNRLFALTGLNPAPIFQLEDGFKRVKKFSKRLDRRLPDQIKKRADDRWRDFARHVSSGVYGESNSITARLTGLDLGKLGYEMREPRDGRPKHLAHRA